MRVQPKIDVESITVTAVNISFVVVVVGGVIIIVIIFSGDFYSEILATRDSPNKVITSSSIDVSFESIDHLDSVSSTAK